MLRRAITGQLASRAGFLAVPVGL